MMNHNHAIVIGGSIAGLLTAKVLSQHFQRVTILERDPVEDEPQVRKGQPHARHTHVLLVRGMEVLNRYFPTLLDELVAGGAVLGDLAQDLRWFAAGGYRLQHESGIPIIFVSRPFLEWHVRRAVLAEPQITLKDQMAVEGLTTTADQQRVTGVQVTERAAGEVTQPLEADLVVDTTGRGSNLPRWLTALGYPEPPTSEIRIDVGYSTRVYRRHDEWLDGVKGVLLSPHPPAQNHLGVVFPIENGRWIVGLGGWGGDYPPTDEAGFLACARNLATMDVYEIIRRAEPLSAIMVHRVPSNLWRRYERMRRFPEGLLVLGDAFCSL